MLSMFLGPGNDSHTFHQDNKNIPHDGEGGAQDKYGEQEGADGVSNLIFWLKETSNPETENQGKVLSGMLIICVVK